MRQVVLDTETTGLEVSQGHRIIEIGCVEVLHRRTTDQLFHQFLNPEREIDAGAQEVHGISLDFLADKPKFASIADDFIEFVADAELIIHNASFDVGFINAELKKMGHRITDINSCCKVIDSLGMARKMHPGQKNNLDALCKRYEIDNSHRELHGALLDAQILADVYLALTGGQTTLSLAANADSASKRNSAQAGLDANREALKVIYASDEELQAHDAFLNKIQQESEAGCVWSKD
ncbi:MAG: DNA polymerase III subunit epsilon [Gammaproteobacteria bacterium]|nr:MAG: DNA polymerase III subunit epsilon [Gammaproteobacteria bacterium]